jgi:hypothetical protein
VRADFHNPTGRAIKAKLRKFHRHFQLSRGVFYLRWSTASVRILPNFLIIGAQKSGTTTLYAYLNQHPAVARALTQEVHYFDLNFHRGLSWYRAHFPTTGYARRIRGALGTDLLTGEASAYYLFHPRVCRRVWATLPQARLIIVLRDPVERAWAQYLQNRATNLEDLAFEDAIDREQERLAGEQRRLLEDDTASSFSYREHSYLSRGIYVDQIRPWMELFPREQIHIVSSEELLFRDPVSIVAQVQDFLGLPRRPLEQLRIYPSEAGVPINDATRARLREHFGLHNQRLFEYLGRDFGWGR